MERDYFPFYWTFPVPCIGFRSLPARIEDAAKASRTIRSCRARVRGWLTQSGGALLPDCEVAMIELAPDRGSPAAGDALRRLPECAEARGARVAPVDFSDHRG